MLVELALSLAPGLVITLRVARKIAAVVRLCQRRHKLAPKHLGQGLHWEQEVRFARWSAPLCVPMTVLCQHTTSHHRMHMDVALQVLRPGVQDQTERRCTPSHTHPPWVGRKLAQGLRGAGKQGVDHPARVGAIQGVEAVGQREHQVRIGHGQHLGQSALQPGVLGARTALRAMPVAAGVVLPVAVAAGVAAQLLTTQCSGAAGNDTAPGFGLGRAQGVGVQVRTAKAAQYLCHARGQGGHAAVRYSAGRPASRSSGSMSWGGLNWGLMRCR